MLNTARRTRLALLSNAPEPLAAAIERSQRVRHFDHRFYSCGCGDSNPSRAHSPTR